MAVYKADSLEEVGVHLISSVPDRLLPSLIRCIVIYRVDTGAWLAIIPRNGKGAISPVVLSIAKGLYKPAKGRKEKLASKGIEMQVCFVYEIGFYGDFGMEYPHLPAQDPLVGSSISLEGSNKYNSAGASPARKFSTQETGSVTCLA